MLFEKDYGEGVIAIIPLHKKAKELGSCEKAAEYYSKKFKDYAYEIENCFLKIKIKDYVEALKNSSLIKIDLENKPQRAILDFSSPNIGKPFHVGHLRSTILGESLSRFYEFLGSKVIRWNYLGDWGIQYGKLIEAYKKWGNERELKTKGLRYLFELYVKAHNEGLQGEEEFKKLERGDKENKKLWLIFRDISLKEFKKMYDLLNIRFDIWKGESHYYEFGKEVIEDALNKKVGFEDKDKSIVIDLKPFGLPNLVISKRGERSLYATRDLACLKERCNLAEKIMYVVGNEQSLYFKQVFKAAELLDYCSSTSLEHVSFGLLTLPKGKFSTRKGNVIFVDDLISTIKKEVTNALKSKGVDVGDEDIMKVVVSTLSYALLSQARRKDFVFDVKKFVSFEGNTAMYLLYTYKRAKNLINEVSSHKMPKEIKHPISRHIIVLMHRFPFYVKKAYDNNDTYYLALYAYELAKTYNKLYQQQKFIGTEYEQEGIAISYGLIEKLEIIFHILNLQVPTKI